jgi:plastocyanin
MKTSKQFSRILSGMIFLSAILLSNSCSKDNNPDTTLPGGGGPGANEVFIQSNAFSPSSITVTAGTTIKWTNKDGIAHTVTSNTNIFDSGTIPAGGTFSYTFASAGTFPYYCKIHPSMVAGVTVN